MPHSKVRNLVLGAGIFLVFMFVLAAGFRAFYPGPEYSDFCQNEFARPIPLESSCVLNDSLRLQEQQCYAQDGVPQYEYNASGCIASVSCSTCNRDYTSALSDYTNVVFIVSLIVGVIVLLVGLTILSLEPVGSALIASGIGAVIYGVIRNWQNFTAVWRFILLFLVLVGLIYFAVRLNRKR